VSGRLSLAVSVLLHLIGNVAGFAGPLREWWKFTGHVVKM